MCGSVGFGNAVVIQGACEPSVWAGRVSVVFAVFVGEFRWLLGRCPVAVLNWCQ